MANIIPPLVSDSPPPPPSEDDEEDEFDDFRESNDVSYGCDSFSLTPSPEQSPKKITKEVQSGKTESDFNFDSISPKTITDSKHNLQYNESEESHFPKDNLIVSNKLSTELSASESSKSIKITKEDSNHLHKNNYVNKDVKDNIPSQLIFENKNSNHENKMCDSSDKISITNQEVLEEDILRDLILSNGFSVEKTDSAGKFTDFTDCSSEESGSANNSSILSESHLKLSSNENPDFKSNTADYSDLSKNTLDDDFTNFSSFSIDATKSDTHTNVIRQDFEDQNIDLEFNKFSSYPIHSKNTPATETLNLVNDGNLQNISKNALDDKTKDLKELISYSTESSKKTTSQHCSLNVEHEDNDFDTYISQPINTGASSEIEISEDTVIKSKDKNQDVNSEQQVQGVSEYLENKVEAEHENNIYFPVQSIETVNSEPDILNMPPNCDVHENSKYLEDKVNISEVKFNSIESSTTEFKIRHSDHESIKEFSHSIQNDDNDDDDFANFEAFTAVSVSNKTDSTDFNIFSSRPPEDTESVSSSEFGNFASFPSESVSNTKQSTQDDDFVAFPSNPNTENINPDDFGDFTSVEPNFESKRSETEDDFGDFTSCTDSTLKSQKFGESSSKQPYHLLSAKEAFTKAEEIIKHMFPPVEEVLDDFQFFELGKDDFIFEQLQDITESPALKFNWSNSTGQKKLLKSLNIDSRNILYGPSWNPSVPRFASNLGVQPLEPVKMEPLTPTPKSNEPVAQTSNQSQSETQDVPSAQFDWTNSGLVNPLDSAPSGSTPQPTKHEDPKPDDSEIDDYGEFTAFQSSRPPQILSNWPSIPLRETYISEIAPPHIDVDVCLQPTIVTPEMSRKTINTQDDLAASEMKVDDDKEDDTEFDDFQSYSDSSRIDVNKEIIEDVEVTLQFQNNLVPGNSIFEITPTIATVEPKELGVVFQKNDLETEVVSTKTLTEDSSSIFPESNIAATGTEPRKSFDSQSTPLGNEILEDDDDDFTEFHSSVALPQPQSLHKPQPAVLAPILEPLKPTPVYSTLPSTQINWPDPGITDDDIRKFEEAFSVPTSQKHDNKPNVDEKPKKEKSTEVVETAKVGSTHSKKSEVRANPRTDFPLWDTSPVNKPHKLPELKAVHKKTVVKQESVEDEEWSDFVSVQKPSPIHKTRFSDRNQTSSPDLPLSVLNLGSIQPTKQPIPVITPQGLVQTKLSTNMNSAGSHKSNVINPKPSYDTPSLQPSIISNQYASQAYNVGMNAPQSYSFAMNPTHTSASQKPKEFVGNVGAKGQEDDDWGEFISSPLPPQFQNSSTTIGHQNWNQYVPNMRSNAGQSHQSHLTGEYRKAASSSTGTQKKNSNMSGLVLPELDFLALKQRTGVPRKK